MTQNTIPQYAAESPRDGDEPECWGLICIHAVHGRLVMASSLGMNTTERGRIIRQIRDDPGRAGILEGYNWINWSGTTSFNLARVPDFWLARVPRREAEALAALNFPAEAFEP